MATPRPTSARASAFGLPTSRAIRRAVSSVAAASASPAARSAPARSAAGARRQERPAARAISAMVATCSGEAAATSTTTSSGRCGELLAITASPVTATPSPARWRAGSPHWDPRGAMVGERGRGYGRVMVVTARSEHVGSLLRPPYLLQAREALAAGALDEAAFKRVEDRAVREVIALQEQAGCPVVTDGELRRDSFQSELTAAVDGFEGVGMDAWLWGEWHSTVVGDAVVERPPDLGVVAPLRRRRSLAAEEFTFLRASTDRTAKVTLPSPTLFANLWSPKRSADAYPTLDDCMADVVAILRDEVRELNRLGCTYVQLDAPHYPLLVDPGWRAFYESRGWPLERWLSYGISLDNEVIDAGRPATFGFHLCRGNQHSRWLVAGGYEPLGLVPDDKLVVLGLVTTKTPRLETAEELERRLREAARLVGTERLALGTQCGFATSVRGNAIGTQDERRKLELICRTAERLLSGAGGGAPGPTTP